MEQATLIELVENRRKELGLTMADVAERALGSRKLTPIQDLKRGASPGFDKVQRVCEALGLELRIELPRPPSNHELVQQLELLKTLEAREGDFVRVPFFQDVRLSAGPGGMGAETVSTGLAFRLSWLHEHNLRADHCCVVTVAGISMEPTLRDGDLVLLDRSARELVDRKVYGIVDIEGETRVKRLEKKNGVLLLRSDNPEEETEIRQPDEANRIEIIGRVVWNSHVWPR